MGMQIWQKADVGQSVKLNGDEGGVPAGSVGIVTHVDGISQVYTVRVCGVDRFLYGGDFEVNKIDGIGASESVASGSAQQPGEVAANGAGDVSGACEKCGRVFEENRSAS